MPVEIEDIFASLAAPPEGSPGAPQYTARPIPGFPVFFVAKDHEGCACLLVAARDGRHPPPIRLEHLTAQFGLRCVVHRDDGTDQEGAFTVVRCRSQQPEMRRYFLFVCEAIARALGDSADQTAISKAVQRLAAIFQSMAQPPARSISGLFGELYLISRSGSSRKAVAAWRTDNTSRFDFTDGDVRIDVKATAGRTRVHTFSYDQCNPPTESVAVVASLFAERVQRGLSLRSLISRIEAGIGDQADLALKLHEIVAATLGREAGESLEVCFDPQLAESSLAFFALDQVPAIRGEIPPGVSDVHFRSDLSGIGPLSIQQLIDRDPLFWDLLPQGDPA